MAYHSETWKHSGLNLYYCLNSLAPPQVFGFETDRKHSSARIREKSKTVPSTKGKWRNHLQWEMESNTPRTRRHLQQTCSSFVIPHCWLWSITSSSTGYSKALWYARRNKLKWSQHPYEACRMTGKIVRIIHPVCSLMERIENESHISMSNSNLSITQYTCSWCNLWNHIAMSTGLDKLISLLRSILRNPRINWKADYTVSHVHVTMLPTKLPNNKSNTSFSILYILFNMEYKSVLYQFNKLFCNM